MADGGTFRAWLRASLHMATFAALTLIAACWLCVAFVSSVEYDKTVEGALRQSDSLVRLFEENTLDIFERVDRTLLLLRKSIEDDPDHFDLRNWAARAALVSGETVQLSLIGADGYQVATTTGYGGPPLYLGDRQHFLQQLDLDRDSLFISEPVVGRASGKTTLQLSRRVRHADGGFGGVIVASIDPNFIERFFRTVDFGNRGSIMLRNPRGVILAAQGLAGGVIGKQLNQSLFLDALAQSRTGHFEGDGNIDGKRRLVAYRMSDKFPLVFTVGISEDDMLRGYAQHRATYLVMAAIGTLLILTAMVFTIRRQVRLDRGQELVRQLNYQFDAALSHMTQGLCMFDGAKRLVVSNDRFAELYQLAPDLLRVGTPHDAIIADRIRRGILKGDRSELSVEDKIRSLDQLPKDATSSRIDELSDGRFILVTRKPLADGGWLATHEDVTERRRAESEIVHLARHDVLTGLANRAEFNARLDEASRRRQRSGGAVTLMMLDLDRFKQVNDTLGHPAGDRLLVEVARRLRASVRDTDILARLGGDEFAIIQEGGANQHEGAITLALRIISAISEPFDLDGQQASVGTSIGIVHAPEHGVEPEDLLKKADLALCAVKAGGRNDFRVFEPGMIEESLTQQSAEDELRDALAREEFELHYQPVVDARTRRLCGVEALVRWRHPTRGLTGPDQFIPLAESTGMISQLGAWVVRRACSDVASWPAHVKVSVNVSPVQFKKGNLFDVILCTLVETGLSPERLELEISETALLENQAAHLATIRQLKNLGISIALDDFGTGYSSLSYLTIFPFDKIKIDKSFTQGVLDRQDCRAIVSSTIALAKGLGIVTTAEGVETEAEFDYMRNAGVDLVQGHLLGRAVPFDQVDVSGSQWPARMVA